MLAAAGAAAVEGPVSRVVEVAELRAAGVAEEHTTGCCRIAALTEESKEAVVAYRHLHSVAGCRRLVAAVVVVYADPVDNRQL